MDFYEPSIQTVKGKTIIFPRFIVNNRSKDLMIRGQDFYAVWLEEKGLWSTDEQDLIELIDKSLDIYANDPVNKEKFETKPKILYMADGDSKMINKFHSYCKEQSRDNYHPIDEKIIFNNSKTNKKDYASKRVPYDLDICETPSWDRIISTLYNPEERHKIEWAIGAVLTGEAKRIQKFLVFYGAPKTGKSTILHIIEQLFDGYYCVFDSKAIGSASAQFALEPFRNNPLVGIQHDGDLSHIEDNTRLNSLISHEEMVINEKHKSTYTQKFITFLFMGTNKPVKITDARSGLLRRLIDVTPTGNIISPKSEYTRLMSNIKFELGGIASKCIDVFQENPGCYDEYIPLGMLDSSNEFYNFVSDYYYEFKKEDHITLKQARKLYKEYCDEADVKFPLPQMIFKEELKAYYEEYYDRYTTEDGIRVRSYFNKFKASIFETPVKEKKQEVDKYSFLDLKEQHSILDDILTDSFAQYASDEGTPVRKWCNVTTKLKDINTHMLHYVKVPENHIVIDFDIRGEDGSKSLEKNIEKAKMFPPTYAEISKSGNGLHLHYIYKGDVTKLSALYDDNIEIKVFKGNSSLRRMLTKCNDLDISTISSGLPQKGEKPQMTDYKAFENDKHLMNHIRTIIKRSLNKEYGSTTQCIHLIDKVLKDAYDSGIPYDATPLRGDVLQLASRSTNQASHCIEVVNNMKWQSEEQAETAGYSSEKLCFFDIEVWPNLLLLCYCFEDSDEIFKVFNPSPEFVENFFKNKLVGFNCRRYDNHILYARSLGYSNEDLYSISKGIINKDKSCFFGSAYNVSYTDIYDFSSDKKSLKKFEIELGLNHMEMESDWNAPLPEDKWEAAAEYCCNDVYATKKVFFSKDRQADYNARLILAEIAGMTPNDTTNSLTTRIIFGKEKKPELMYRDLGDCSETSNVVCSIDNMFYPDGIPGTDPEYTLFTNDNKPVFPGYKYDCGKSYYRDELVGEGGYVYAEPGIHRNVALLDISSMHPSSIIAENLFGKYTKNFQDIRDARILIKHKEFEKAGKMFDGKLAKYLKDPAIAKVLAFALKIAINSVYGLTAATFDNPFRDIRNIDNIVAKRGALFMINLKHEVQNRGFTVAHIKTDSIKIPDATPEIIDFVMEYGRAYGYNFEHESTYEKMCLVNDAVYIAKVAECSPDYEEHIRDNGHPWTATGAQFAVPYIFKNLFSKQPMTFKDYCEVKQVTSCLYLDFNEDNPDERNLRFVGKVGEFLPVKPGTHGALLLREATDKEGNIKYDSAVGAKGYRWVESSDICTDDNFVDRLDISYYRALVDDVVSEISKYGDYDEFCA